MARWGGRQGGGWLYGAAGGRQGGSRQGGGRLGGVAGRAVAGRAAGGSVGIDSLLSLPGTHGGRQPNVSF